MIKFLIAAYAATWLIHLSYIGILARGYKQVREEMKELKNGR